MRTVLFGIGKDTPRSPLTRVNPATASTLDKSDSIDLLGQRSLYISCTLKIPSSLTRLPPRQPFATPPIFGLSKTAAPPPPLHPIGLVPDLSLPQSLISSATNAPQAHSTGDVPGPTPGDGTPNLGSTRSGEVYREIKCCFSVTIRRDAWGVPVAIMGQWIVSTHTSHEDFPMTDRSANMRYQR